MRPIFPLSHCQPPAKTLAIFAIVVLAGTCLQPHAGAQELRVQATPLTAWIDLRPAAPEAGPQTAPNWIEDFQYVPAKKASNTVESVSVQISGAPTDGTAATPAATDQTVTASGESVYRVRLHRPAANVGDLQIRVFYEDRADGGRPYLSVWNELGSELMRSNPMGQGLGLPSSETFTVPMTGADYLELAAPGDASQLRAVFLSWLEKVDVQQPADFASKEAVREPFGIQAATHTRRADGYLYGVVTARLQDAKPVVLKPDEAPAAAYEFQLERQPLVAVISYEVLGATVGESPTVAVNGAPAASSEVHLPDLADPGYQGQTREGAGGMSFRYTGWVHAQKVIPGNALAAGLNNLTVALSKDSDPVAIRSVQIQLKYNWEKLDYLVTPTPTSAPASYDAP